MTGITKRFGDNLALDGVSLEVAHGEVHGLVGQNGCGKSTLIKILSGYYIPEPGAAVAIDGVSMPLGHPNEIQRAGVRFVHQHLGVIDELSVMENIALSIGYRRTRRGRIDWRAQEVVTRKVLSLLGVELDLRRPAGQCQHVERAVIAIARALEDGDGQIRVLVLDEPTAALPPTEVDRLFTVIEQIRGRGVGIVYVSHRLDEIDALTDRVTFLRDGRSYGTRPTHTVTRPEMVRLIVGRDVEEHAHAGRASEAPADRRPDTDAAVDADAGAGAGRSAAAVLRVRGLRSATIHDIDIDIDAGEVVGIAGLQGSGREEVASAIYGAVPSQVERLTIGETTWTGSPRPRQLMRAGAAMVVGNREPGAAIGEFDLRENVTLPILHRCRRGPFLTRIEEVRMVRRWIEELEVRPADHGRRFAHLSGGNQQKIVLSKWLNRAPTLLMLDDPTAGVDIGARQDIYRQVERVAAEGVAVLVASSDVKDLTTLCDRVLVVDHGAVVAELQSRDVSEETILAHMQAREDSAA